MASLRAMFEPPPEDVEPPAKPPPAAALRSMFEAAPVAAGTAAPALQEEGRASERAPLLQATPTPPRVARWAMGVLRSRREKVVDVCGGVTGFFFATVFVCTFASSVSAPCPWMDARMTSELARLGMLSYVVIGSPYLALTRLWYPMPIGPDLAVAPMLAQIAESVGRAYADANEDAEAAMCVFMLVSTVGALVTGVAVLGLSRYGLLRFAEFLPFPVVGGLLASIGAGLVKSAARLGAPPTATWGHRVLALGLSVTVAALDVAVQSVCNSTALRFAACVFAPTAVATFACRGDAWFFPAPALGSEAFQGLPPLYRVLRRTFFSTTTTTGGRRHRTRDALSAVSLAIEPALAMIVLAVLKAPVLDAALRRAVRATSTTTTTKDTNQHRRPASDDAEMPSQGELTNEALREEHARATRRARTLSEDATHDAATTTTTTTAAATTMGSTRREMVLVGLANAIACVAGLPAILAQQVSLSVLTKAVGAPRSSKLPGIVMLVLAVAASAFPASFLMTWRVAIPRFVYAGLVTSQGLFILHSWVAIPARYLQPAEVGVIVGIVSLSLARGFAVGVSAGAVASVALFAWANYYAPVVKYVATAQTFRSNRARDAVDRDTLDATGDRIAVVVLQGYLFFGNGRKVINFVAALLEEDEASTASSRGGGVFVAIDCCLCLGADASAIDAVLEVGAKVAATHQPRDLDRDGPACYLAACPEPLRDALRRRGAAATRLVSLAPDLDRAVESCEDRLLLGIRRTRARHSSLYAAPVHARRSAETTTMSTSTTRIPPRADGDSETTSKVAGLLMTHDLPEQQQQHQQHQQRRRPRQGEPRAAAATVLSRTDTFNFREALRFGLARTMLMAAPDGPEVLSCLEVALASRAKLARLPSGHALMSRARAGEPVDPVVDALYIVSTGRIAVKHDPKQTTGGHLSKLASPTFRRRRNPWALAFRLAELGPGSFIGIEELATRVRSAGVFVAQSDCVLHKIAFGAIDDLIRDDHYLGACLWRLVAALLAENEENLKFRLSSTVDALYAKPLTKPIRRATLKALATL